MARGDGKNKFYRELNLDDDTKKILKWYKKASKELLNDEYEKEIEKDGS